MEKHTAIGRWQVLKKVIDGKMTLREASFELDVSYRQAVRMKKAVMANGIRGLIHGNTGRKPTNALSEDVRSLIVVLSQNGARSLNDTRFAEMLGEKHQIKVSRETVRQIRREQNIPPLKTRNPSKVSTHHGRPREGMCLFWDGIISKWFPKSDYACCLIAVLDDASGRCITARFFPFEESAVYLWALQHVVVTCGIPKQMIQDRNSLFQRKDSDWSLEEQLRGSPEPTQVGKALEAFGIEQVFVKTKRQKRYFERIFEQLNICLVEDLQQRDIADLNAGNRFLEDVFIREFNRRYALSGGAVEACWQKPKPECDPERVCGFCYEGKINERGTVNIGSLFIPLSREYNQAVLGHKTLEVRQLLDGSWKVYHENRIIGQHPPTPLLEPVRARIRPKRNTTRASECVWTYPETRQPDAQPTPHFGESLP